MYLSLYLSLFQSTPPRGRRHLSLYLSLYLSLFQSTPPRGRRQRKQDDPNPILVSIHASAREATRPIACKGRSSVVSIHASAREATEA